MREEGNVGFVRAAAFVLGLSALGIFALLPSAAAAPQSAGPAVAAPDLSTVPGIVSHLRSLGVARSEIVIQRGAKNYAGPNCPGMAWHCTSTSGIVVQSAQAGMNKFECTPADYGTDPETNMCVVFQSNVDGKNTATCRESTGLNPAVLTCDVTQFNVNGDNHANIDQNVDQGAGATQEATVSAELEQDNESGSNHANLSQSISQSTSQVSGLLQSQDADFDANVFQDTDTGGNNFLQQSQTLMQDGRASGPSSISQSQTADHFGNVEQQVSEDGEASYFAARGARLLQATASEGFSKAHVTQTERQTLKGPGSQEQFGPMNCCGAGSQEGSPQQTLMTIQQSSTQKASQFSAGSAEQKQFVLGDCNTTGTCTIHHNVTNEADSLNQKTSGTGIQELVTTCFAGSGEGGTFGECFEGGGED